MIDTLSGGNLDGGECTHSGRRCRGQQYVYFNSATCPASGDCISVGGYKAQNGSNQGLIETATFKRGL